MQIAAGAVADSVSLSASATTSVTGNGGGCTLPASASRGGGSIAKWARLITVDAVVATTASANGAKICSGSAGSLTAARARVAAKPVLPRVGTISSALSRVRPVAPTAARARAATAEVVAATGSGAGLALRRRVTAAITASAAVRGFGGGGATSRREASSARCTALSS